MKIWLQTEQEEQSLLNGWEKRSLVRAMTQESRARRNQGRRGFQKRQRLTVVASVIS